MSAATSRAGSRLRHVVVALACGLTGFGSGAAPTVTIYAPDRPRPLVLDFAQAAEVLRACDAQIEASESVLRLAVSKERVDALRRGGLAVEVDYGSAHRWTRARDGRPVEANRIFVPLHGEWAAGPATTFIANPDYSAGPLRSTAGSATLERAVRALLASVPN